MNISKLLIGLYCAGMILSSCSQNESMEVKEIAKDEDGTEEKEYNLKHPGVLFSLNDLENLRDNMIKEEKAAYDAFVALPTSNIDYKMKGPYTLVDEENMSTVNNYYDDAKAVFYQAIQWYITGNEKYAQNAMDMLRAWSTTHNDWNGPTTRLVAGTVGMDFAAGAEILRHCYSGWEEDLNDLLSSYFMNMLWTEIGGNKTYKTLEALSAANQGAMALRSAIAMAVFLDDKEMFDNVIDAAIYHPAAGLLMNTLDTGQFSDFGRDMGHAGGMLKDWAMISETAWHQGIDLYGFEDNLLRKCVEYYCEYCTTDGDWRDRYQLFGAQYSWYRGPGSDNLKTGGPEKVEADRKNLNHDWLSSFYLYKGAYENRKNTGTLTYTNKYADAIENQYVRNIEEIFLFTRKKYDVEVVVPEIKIRPTEKITGFTLSTEGNKNEAQLQTVEEDGVTKYVLSGRGYFSSDPSLAYYEMEGEGAIIVKLEDLTINDNYARAFAGLMLRESMDSNLHAWINTNIWGPERTDQEYRVEYYDWDLNTSYTHKHGFTPYEDTKFLPMWFKMERTENRIATYESWDGVIWIANGFRYKEDGQLPKKYLLGLVVTTDSQNKSATATATFSHVEFLKYK